ncbi:MAG: DUF58 domain-containing protein, partial [Thermoguttaceae bacterium]|nr:DUF58 domain-containing protein [Thermoguttaceae bacterium]
MDNDYSVILEYALYLVFPALVLPLLIAAFFFKTFPSKITVYAFFVVALASSFSFLLGQENVPTSVVVALDVLFVAIVFADWLTAAFQGRGVVVTRNAEHIVSLGQPLDVELVVTNLSKRPVSLELIDDANKDSRFLPAASDDLLSERDEKNEESDSAAVFGLRKIDPNTQESLRYRLVWDRRGSFQFEYVFTRYASVLGLWKRYIKIPCKSSFQVYPNLCQLAQFQTLGRSSLLFLLGVRQMRRVGQDAEFERLRDYTQDDQYKFIDWKATARRNKLIVRDFQTTRNQRVIIAIDAGRTTMNRSGGVTLFDSALNASLALAYIALKQGDEVGCLIFSDEVRKFVPPRGGISQMNALIRGVFDVFPERCESRYDRAFEYLAKNSPKRALVVLATNILDERNAALVENSLVNLSGAHLPLGLFLREHSLFDAVEQYEELERKQNVESDKEYFDKRKQKNPLALWIERFVSERE